MADSDPITFTRESGFRIARAVKRIEGAGRGEVPHPKRTRHVIDGSRGGGSGFRRAGRVIVACPAATDNLVIHYGAGGTLHYMDEDGAEITDTDVDFVNPLQTGTIDTDFWVEVDTSFTPVRVTDHSCGPWNWAATE